MPHTIDNSHLPEHEARSARPLARASAKRAPRNSSVWLDYRQAGREPKLLANLSAIAVAGEHLWTASDEGRTIECLAPYRGAYRLHRQYALDDLFPGLPRAALGQEADIEALDVIDGRLWVCGSHSLTRRSQRKTKSDHVDARIRKRPSRRLLGAVTLSEDGNALHSPGRASPFAGPGSLRAVLRANPYIAPFMELPSKENGLDIEGLTVFRKKVHIGLRGPVVDNIAIVAAIGIRPDFAIDEASVVLHFVDLGGLGVRDLARWNDGILVLAGPVSTVDGPFALFHWQPRRTDKIQKPRYIRSFPSGPDHPEGICVLRRGEADGLIVLYDTSDPQRTKGTRYCADWIRL